MTRVHVICEGQTEETFVNEVLSVALRGKGVYLYPSLVGKPGHKGGALRPQRLLTDVRARLLCDTNAYCTTFLDFYGLPGDFPGRKEAARDSGARDKAGRLLDALTQMLRADIAEEAMRRFIPYVQMHEFEGLLFSDVPAFARGINQHALAESLQRVRDAFESPEEINDDVETAPSKRITKLFTAYEKPIHGSLAAMEIGLDTIRRECPLFDEWLSVIESLPRRAVETM